MNLHDNPSQADFPLVSAVITTVNRPRELECAINSVLAQSFQNFEIVVVVDGPTEAIDEKYVSELDSRVRVISLAHNVGLAEARNCGIREARGKWIALLDDDDVWLPGKLEAQIKATNGNSAQFVFVPCRFIERTSDGDRVMPEALPSSSENFSEYIYCRHGYLQPSMYFFSRALGMSVPFTKGLRHVEDSDWMLRMSVWPNVVILPVEACLSVYFNLRQGQRESETTPWRSALAWGVENQSLFTCRAFPYFVARLCINARRSGESPKAFLQLFRIAPKYGSCTPRVLVYFFSYSLFSPRVLRSIRKMSKFPGRRETTDVVSVPAQSGAHLGGQSC